jgi:hypothetical protein
MVTGRPVRFPLCCEASVLLFIDTLLLLLLLL